MKSKSLGQKTKSTKVKPQNRGGVGGAANESGSDFRAKVGAWLVSHALAGRRIPDLELPQNLDTPTGLLMPESDMPVDDLEVQLSNGGQLFIQAKQSLSLSTKHDSEFGKTALQLSKMASIEGFSSLNTRLAIIVGESTKPLCCLQRALSGLRKPKSAALTKEESSALETLKSHLKHLSKEQLEEILKATVVIIRCLAPPNSSTEETCIAQLAQVVLEGHQELAWQLLVAKVKQLAVNRVGIGFNDWVECLQQGTVVFKEDLGGPPAAVRAYALRALQNYKTHTISRGSKISLFGFSDTLPQLNVSPTTKDLLATVGQTQVQLSWLIRRLGKVTLLGLPGVGKSTALRRLAAEIASLKIGPLPLFVSLPQFVDGFSKNKNILEELVRIGTEFIPDADRSIIYQEILQQLRNTGQAIIILDSLDECRHCRHELIQTLQTAFEELHPDVEIIVSTRDSAYAQASALGFHEATLEPPKNLGCCLKELAEHLAEAQKVPTQNRNRWIQSLLAAVQKHKEKESSFHQTPLVLTAMLIIASERGIQSIANGRAQTLSLLVDRLAHGWEIEHRRQGKVEISHILCEKESADFVLQIFDLISYLLDKSESISKDYLLSQLSAWAQKAWDLPPARAFSAAEAAVKFWDNSGIFVASGSNDFVRARYATLQEIGVARWLARSDQEENRNAWLACNSLDENHAESLVFLAGLNLASVKQLTNLALTSRDRKLALLMARAFSETHLAFPELDRPILITTVLNSLLPHVAEGGAPGWEIIATILKLPLTQENADLLVSIIPKTFDKYRVERVAAILFLILHPLEKTKQDRYIELLKAGPMPAFVSPKKSEGEYLTGEDILAQLSIDHLYNFLAFELASKIGLEMPDLARSLVLEDRVSTGTHLEIIRLLENSGYQKIIVEAENSKKESWSSARCMAWIEESRQSDNVLFQIVSTLANPKTTYTQRRRCCELADFWTTIIPGDLPANVVSLMLLKQPEFITTAIRLASQLGGFHPETVSGQMIAVREDGYESNLYMYFAGQERTLANWPDGDERINMLEKVLKLFSSTVWPARLATLALLHYPVPAEAACALETAIPSIKHSGSRHYAGYTLINLSPNNITIAQKWLSCKDPVLVSVAATSLAIMFQNNQISIDILAPALLKTDIAVREKVQKDLEKIENNPELESLLLQSRQLPAGSWSCSRCGEEGIDSSESACSKCKICR